MKQFNNLDFLSSAMDDSAEPMNPPAQPDSTAMDDSAEPMNPPVQPDENAMTSNDSVMTSDENPPVQPDDNARTSDENPPLQPDQTVLALSDENPPVQPDENALTPSNQNALILFTKAAPVHSDENQVDEDKQTPEGIVRLEIRDENVLVPSNENALVPSDTVAPTPLDKSAPLHLDDLAAPILDEDQVDEDKYKLEGTVRLEIREFSQYAQRPKTENRLTSEPVFIRGFPWNIMVQTCRDSSEFFSFFVQCNADAKDEKNWSCDASAVLRMCSQREDSEPFERQLTHVFKPKANDQGFHNFMPYAELLDENKGYIKDDSILLEADIKAGGPYRHIWDSRYYSGHVGLKNQGATCYMNLLLQTLFFTNKFRKAVYSMPIKDEDSADSQLVLAIQCIFADLQCADQPVSTRLLTKALGWGASDSLIEHDVHEVSRQLLDKFESMMKGTDAEKTIPDLFKGIMRSYIRCLDIEFESARNEDFYDVQLNIQDKPNIIESFREYVKTEILEDDNAYDAEGHGLQRAEKGVKFVSFPPVLHLQLLRFQYDPMRDENVKINGRCEFPEILDLNEFVEEKDEEDYKYRLQAVLVHCGSSGGGHYVVYINTALQSGKSRWFRFDDDVVTRVLAKEAIEDNYGTDQYVWGRKSHSNAYVLVYIQESKLDDVLCPVSDDDILFNGSFL